MSENPFLIDSARVNMASFRQIDEHHIPAKASILEWNPKMDLIALANVQGKVVLHRLTWQKVWILQPPGGQEKDIKVQALAWRPDGRILAVAYDTGEIHLCDVENSEILEVIQTKSCVTCMTWNETLVGGSEDATCYRDRSADFLPKLPPLSKTYGSVGKQSEENAEDSKKLKDQTALNILAVATEDAEVALYAFGIFPSGRFHVKSDEIEEGAERTKIVSLAFSHDLSNLSAFVETKSSGGATECCLFAYDIPLVRSKHLELQIVALKYGQLASLLNYMSVTIGAISEAWEDILLEIDSKLAKYAEEKHGASSGTVSDDFLELLMFGTPTDSLEKFLLHDLTEKGLKKLGQSIELSYSNIQKLVLKHLQCVTQALFYHLSDLKGMAAWHGRFGSVGLLADKVQEAATAVGSFLTKATEIQQAIDSGMKNFKAFFRWLYGVILRLSDEPIPPEISNITLQDLNFVANFLQENFATEWTQESKASFSLERVGQYLKKQNLPFPASTSNNPWVKFLDLHPDVMRAGILYPHHPEKSLVEQHEEVKESIARALSEPSNVISNCLSRKLCLNLFNKTKEFPVKFSHAYNSSDGYLYALFAEEPSPASHLCVLRRAPNDGKAEGLRVAFGATENGEGMQKVLDFQFYSEELITLLLLREGPSLGQSVPVLGQLPIKFLANEFRPAENGDDETGRANAVDAETVVDVSNARVLENMKASSVAVSGPRKVACVVFASRRHVRIFDMDVDEEEDEQEDGEQDSTARYQGNESCADKSDVMDSECKSDDDKEN